jgi:predicted nucleotidyltransferase
MATIELHPDFKDFLKLLNSNGVRYLIIGGYAVGYHGYPRATGDMDIWIAIDEENARKTACAVQEFGMPLDRVSEDVFLQPDKIIRMGVPPVRIEVLTGISGVDFNECFKQREVIESDGIPINMISLPMLKKNKNAAGRLKDLDDLHHLP